MIYLIGGPPRCGKSTLVRKMSKKFNIPYLTCDTLDSIVKAYTPTKDLPKKFPYSYLRRKGGARNNDEFYSTYSSSKIISVLKKEGEVVYPAIDMFLACEIADQNDYILEGYHIMPQFADRMIKKYGKRNVKAVFLGKFDAEKFAKDVYKSTTPNDWLLLITKKEETFVKVGKMVLEYSQQIQKQAEKYSLKMFDMDEDFNKQINNVIKYLVIYAHSKQKIRK